MSGCWDMMVKLQDMLLPRVVEGVTPTWASCLDGRAYEGEQRRCSISPLAAIQVDDGTMWNAISMLLQGTTVELIIQTEHGYSVQ